MRPASPQQRPQLLTTAIVTAVILLTCCCCIPKCSRADDALGRLSTGRPVHIERAVAIDVNHH